MSTKSVKLSLEDLDANAVVTLLNEKYGKNTVAMASAATGAVVKFTPTGVAALDFASGGGIPLGRITQIQGPQSSLKTTLSLKIMAQFLDANPSRLGVFIDAEKSFDPFYAQSLGVVLDRMYVVNPDSGEQGLDVLNDLTTTYKEVLMIIDSIAALVPSAEIESSADQQFMGLHPRLINRLMRVAIAATKRSLYDSSAATTTVIALNQLREKIGLIFGNPETTPGGRGKDFAYSMTIDLRSSSGKAITEVVKKHGQSRKLRFGQEVNFKIVKNKVGSSQHEEGTFTYFVRDKDIYKKGDTDNEDALFSFGVFYGVVESDGISFSYRGTTEKKKSFLKGLRSDHSLYDNLYWDILDAIRKDNEGGVDEEPASKKAVAVKRKRGLKVVKRKSATRVRSDA